MARKSYTKQDMLSFGRFCADMALEAGRRGLGVFISDNAVNNWKNRRKPRGSKRGTIKIIY